MSTTSNANARIHDIYRPAEERRGDFREVERPIGEGPLRAQAERCMNCGIPFCHGAGCPLGNLVPDQNRAVALGDWRRAWELLSANSDFPEFTSRVCPALCEGACVHQLDEESVMVRQIEKAITERAFAEGWVEMRPPERESGRRVAVVGAGPAGLSAAAVLRRRGHAVTVYEKEAAVGGLLRYGIPCFKLDKALIDRRRALMEGAGVRFVTGIEVGRDVSAGYLARAHDALVLAVGTPAARDLPVPGRELPGIHFALDLLGGENRYRTGELAARSVDARGKRVVVIGGGDTGSDCVGTAIRHGAAGVLQIEIMPEPPPERSPATPWPEWPLMLRTSSSHLEGCERRWGLRTLRFLGKDRVEGVEVETVDWTYTPEGRPKAFEPRPGSREVLEADLVLLAMGFTGVRPDHPLVGQLGLALTPRNGIPARPSEKVYAVGDCANGPSLVVRAIADAKKLPL